MKRTAWALSCLLTVLPLAAAGQGMSRVPTRVKLRVMAQSVPVRSGPGGSYLEIARVGRDQVYDAIERSPDGAWYRIRLTRGISGWVLSELVWPFEVVDEVGSSEPGLLARLSQNSPLGDGRLTISLQGGTLQSDGMFTLRVGFQPSQYYALELCASESPGKLGNILTYAVELVVAVGPWRFIVPFLAAGAGGGTSLPGQDVRLFSSRTQFLLMGGGGILIALPGINLRLDARRLVLLTADQHWGALALSGGFMLSF